MVDGMPCLWPWQMIKSLFTVLDVAQNLLKNMADVIPHFAKVLHIVPPCNKDAMLSN